MIEVIYLILAFITSIIIGVVIINEHGELHPIEAFVCVGLGLAFPIIWISMLIYFICNFIGKRI